MYGLPGVDVDDTLRSGLPRPGRYGLPLSLEVRTMTRKTNDTNSERTLPTETTLEDTTWEDRPIDPDLHSDLDYALVNWEVVPNSCDDKKVFLPIEESMLKDEAFIVAEPEACCDLGTKL
jgi:hypothetical protein